MITYVCHLCVLWNIILNLNSIVCIEQVLTVTLVQYTLSCGVIDMMHDKKKKLLKCNEIGIDAQVVKN